VLLALNKVDAMPRPALLAIARPSPKRATFASVSMIFGQDGDGLTQLRAALADLMPQVLASIRRSGGRYSAARLARDPPRQLYLRLMTTALRDHGRNRSYEDRKDGSTRIEQTILVEREGKRPIVSRQRRQTIKAIGQAARKEPQTLLYRRVHLFCM